METKVAYQYDRVLFSKKRESNFDTCNNMAEVQKNYAKSKKSKHKRLFIVRFHLYDMSREGRFIETESRLVVT